MVAENAARVNFYHVIDWSKATDALDVHDI